MKKRFITMFAVALASTMLIAGCSSADNKQANEPANEAENITEETDVSEEQEEDASLLGIQPGETDLPDGEYVAEFTTDSSMFHVNETLDDMGTLIVKDGKMTIHITLTSKNILNLFPGLAEDAKKPGAAILEPTMDEVLYPDGLTETVHGFDVPVPYLDEEFDLALIGTKNKWYDHKVMVKSPSAASESSISLPVGEYEVPVELAGGTGRASITSPAKVVVGEDGIIATIEWSSSNYDYMIVDGEKYLPVNTEGNSVFEIPIPGSNDPFPVVADTTAMGNPHEIEYELIFDFSGID